MKKKYRVDQVYTRCLSQMAYFIVSGNEAAVIDPLRDVDIFIKMAESEGVQIKYIFETHFHADFVSGHLDLQQKTGAEIIYGPGAAPAYPVYVARDGETFTLGHIRLKILHTPGHTLESVSIVLEQDGNPEAVFTGDALFAGDVGRPDLAVNEHLTEKDLARMLFNSLQKLKKLPGRTLVYPGHGEGSACGKNIGSELVTTIGFEKKHNYLFSLNNEEDFVEQLTQDLPVPPKYFFIDAGINKKGYPLLNEFLPGIKKMLPVADFEQKLNDGKIQLLDTRPREEVLKTGIIPKSLQIGLDDNFAVWAGALLDFDRELLVVAPENRIDEALIRLARVGFEKIAGVLSGGVANWIAQGKSLQKINEVRMFELPLLRRQNIEVIDVRPQTFFKANHLKNARNIDLIELQEKIGALDKNRKYIIHCQTGYRGMIAYSIFLQNGFQPGNIYYLSTPFDDIVKLCEVNGEFSEIVM